MNRRGFLISSAGASAAVAGVVAAPERGLAATGKRMVWLRIPGDEAVAAGLTDYFTSTALSEPEVVRLNSAGRLPTMAALHRFMVAYSGRRLIAVSDDAGAVALMEGLRMARGRVIFSGEHDGSDSGTDRHAGWGAPEALLRVQAAGRRTAVSWPHALGYSLGSIASNQPGGAERFAVGAASPAPGGKRYMTLVADLDGHTKD